MAVATITNSGTGSFPAANAEAALRTALLESIKSTASIHGVSLPTTAAGQCAASVHLDSLEVVSLLCRIESIVGFELKDSVVKSGGYNSINEAVSHLMPRIEAAWQRHR